MKTLLRRGVAGALLLAVVLFFAPNHAQTQATSKRRIVQQSTPAYPDLARSMALQGIVKLEAVVAADGSVKATAIRGGHPVLAQAAANAVRFWRWEPSGHESHEIVEIKFFPE